MSNETDNKSSTEYNLFLKKFCAHFENSISKANVLHNNEAGYVFLFVRGDEPGMIDVACNLESKTAIRALKIAIESIKQETET